MNTIHKMIYVTAVILFTLILMSCQDYESKEQYDPIIFSTKDSHYRIELDFRCGKSSAEMGALLGKLYRDSIPDFEALGDAYLKNMFGSAADVEQNCLAGLEIAKSRLSQSFRDELEAAASQMSGEVDDFGDGVLSPNEYLLLNLEADMGFLTLCSGMGVSPDVSATGNTLAFRAVDWPVTDIVKIQTVLVRKYDNVQTVGIGYAGMHNGVTTVSSNGLMVSSYMLLNHYSDVEKADASFVESIKKGIEGSSTAAEFAEYVKGTFATHAQIMINDKKETLVIESDREGSVDVRSVTSQLQEGVQWGIHGCVPVVNSFLLNGKTSSMDNSENSARLASMRSETEKAMASSSDRGEKITGAELQQIFSYFSGDQPGLMAKGDLYNGWTQQMVLFDPVNAQLSAWFIAKDKSQELVPHFEIIELPW